MSMFNAQRENVTGIIVPAEDILKAVKQVPPPGGEKPSGK
jgi:hypothetical protein